MPWPHRAQPPPEAVQAEYAGAEQPGALAFDRFPRTVPLRVISADAQEFGAPELQVAHRDLWLRLQRRWLELSDDARLRIAEGAGHMGHRERPGLVVEVVRELVTGARTPPRSPPDRRERSRKPRRDPSERDAGVGSLSSDARPTRRW